MIEQAVVFLAVATLLVTFYVTIVVGFIIGNEKLVDYMDEREKKDKKWKNTKN